MPKKVIIVTLFILIFSVLTLIFYVHFRNTSISVYKRLNPITATLNMDTLLKDLTLLGMLDNGSADFLEVQKNEDVFNEIPEFTFSDINNKPPVGNIIRCSISNNPFTSSKEPLELRFIMRSMLYLRERKLDESIGRIIGISAYFSRNTIEGAEGSQKIKMSTEEFEKLYKECNVADLPIDKQVDILTQQWISNTLYFRRNLYGNELRNIDGLTQKEKLYIIMRDKYFGTTWFWESDYLIMIIELYESNYVESFLSEDEKQMLRPLYERCKIEYADWVERNTIKGARVEGTSYDFLVINEEILNKLFLGKTLTDTIEIMR